MHNLHIMRTYAESHTNACSIVEDYISDFGDENNWRTICGSICEDGTTQDSTSPFDGRYNLNDYSLNYLKRLFNQVVSTNSSTPNYDEEAFLRCASGNTNSRLDWYVASQYCNKRYEIYNFQNKDFDIMTDTLYEYQYDEFGLSDTFYPKNAFDKLYFVLIDMHS